MEVKEFVRIEQDLAEVVHGLAEGIISLDGARIGAAPGELRAERVGGAPDDEPGLPAFGIGVELSIRQLAGGTDPVEKATPGTIRGDLAVNIGRNVIHGSDAPETAQFEIGLWFQPSELSDWTPADQTWRVEA